MIHSPCCWPAQPQLANVRLSLDAVPSDSSDSQAQSFTEDQDNTKNRHRNEMS